MSPLVLNNGHRYYRLCLPGEWPVGGVFKPLEFHDHHFAEAFVRGLCRSSARMEDYEWIRILYSIDQKPRHPYNVNVHKDAAVFIVRGTIQVYLIPHLTQHHWTVRYPGVPAGEGMQYRFIPASVLLTDHFPRDNVRIFRDHGSAEQFIQLLNLTDAHLEAIIKLHAPPTADGTVRSSARMTTLLIELLAKSEVVVEKTMIAAAPPKPLEVESANGPGNRPATLGPHVGGSAGNNNQDDKLYVKSRISDLGKQGHGPQRHEGQVTPLQLDDRVVKGIDPVSGTMTDAYTGKTHLVGRHASKVTSEEAYVKSADHITSTKLYNDVLTSANKSNAKVFSVETPLKEIYGSSYGAHVQGKTRLGTKSDPRGVVDTDFTNGNMKAVFKQDSSGNYNLLTMYPEPSPNWIP